MILKTVQRIDNLLDATWVDDEGKEVYSCAYVADRLQLFRDDVATYGGDIAEYEALIAEVESLYVPPPPHVPTQEEINAENRAYLASTDWYVVRFAETGTPIPPDVLAARQAARAAIV